MKVQVVKIGAWIKEADIAESCGTVGDALDSIGESVPVGYTLTVNGSSATRATSLSEDDTVRLRPSKSEGGIAKW
jgi:hypothetical protein|tara:strand:- start:9432 stop:9656 length:225 start_codon:yes stop_codon:yes gene_type:complete